jgi:UDP-glucose 4-epimerase
MIPLGDLRRRRSLIHIDNLCDAIALAAWHPGASRRTFLLSDGEDVSVAEVAEALAQGCGKAASRVVSVPVTFMRTMAVLADRRAAFEKLAGELLVDSTGFRRATGWRPPRRAGEALMETMRLDLEAIGSTSSSRAACG